MNIYDILHDDIYDQLDYVDQNDWNFIEHFFRFGIYQNYPPLSTWKPILVKIEREQKRTEFPYLSCPLVCSDKAWQILAPLLQDHVELLPLQCESGNYMILKPQIIDCLDRSLAVVKKFDDSDRVMHVVSYAFKTEIIKDKHFFTIPEAFAYNFVSQAFKDCVEANGLEGLIFRKIA